MAQKKTTTKVLSKKDILAASDLPVREIEVPEWGGSIYMRGLTGAERAAYEDQVISVDGRGRTQKFNLRAFRIALVARCIVDADGKRLFSDREMDALNNKSGDVIERLYEIASEMSGVTEDALEEMTENLENGQSGDSGTS